MFVFSALIVVGLGHDGAIGNSSTSGIHAQSIVAGLGQDDVIGNLTTSGVQAQSLVSSEWGPGDIRPMCFQGCRSGCAGVRDTAANCDIKCHATCYLHQTVTWPKDFRAYPVGYIPSALVQVSSKERSEEVTQSEKSGLEGIRPSCFRKCSVGCAGVRGTATKCSSKCFMQCYQDHETSLSQPEVAASSKAFLARDPHQTGQAHR